jgi:hypothetical protein
LVTVCVHLADVGCQDLQRRDLACELTQDAKITQGIGEDSQVVGPDIVYGIVERRRLRREMLETPVAHAISNQSGGKLGAENMHEFRALPVDGCVEDALGATTTCPTARVNAGCATM